MELSTKVLRDEFGLIDNGYTVDYKKISTKNVDKLAVEGYNKTEFFGEILQNDNKPSDLMLYVIIFFLVESRRLCSNKPQATSNKDSNKKFLILDLNGVLLANSFTRRTRNRDFNFRPQCFEFLKVCFSYFVVVAWSSKLRYPCQPIFELMHSYVMYSFLFS